jgi:hypothetical protein
VTPLRDGSVEEALMNASVDTSTTVALRELSRRPPPGVSPGDLQRFLRRNYERVWTRVAQLVEPRRPRDWELTWIGCGQAKRGGEQRAVDLYTGSLFRAHLAIARHSTGRNPQILSAEHGLLAPHEPIRFYDTTLDNEDHWRRWSAGILARVHNYLKHTRQPSILVLAGARYVDGWAPEARALGVTVDEPLRGLELGARRAFARELLLRTPARGLSDTLDVSPRDQLLAFAANFRRRLQPVEGSW